MTVPETRKDATVGNRGSAAPGPGDGRRREQRSRLQRARRLVEPVMLSLTVGGLVAGGIAWLAGLRQAADATWIAATVVIMLPALWWVIDALRRRRVGVDLIAVLSLAGTLVVGEYVAGALIAVMVATGRALDAAAQRRARRDLTALLQHAPRSARLRHGDRVATVPLAEVGVGDVVIVGPGEVVPVDGSIENGIAVLDESVLTGESAQVERSEGDPVRSGVINAGAAFEIRAVASAEQSTYAEIVRLAEQAGAESAPVVRLADRYAVWFLPLSLAVAGLAWWTSGSMVRAVAVLVVATPCPLLLAAPVAIVSGLSRASRIGVVIRDGAALENLGHARSLVMDKTGTLTAGRPAVVAVVPAPGWDADRALRLAASAEQLSPHVLAAAIVAESRRRALPLAFPTDVLEQPGRGVSATVDGHTVEVGKPSVAAPAPAAPAVTGWTRQVTNRAALDGAAIAWISVDGRPAAAVLLRDPLRRHTPRTLRRLREAGLNRLVMLTGDRRAPAEEVGSVLGLDEVRAELSPADKVAAVRRERQQAVTVMVGDGVNDAPALAAATVGVALGARGSSAASEAADIVLTTDRLDRLADAMDIARWSRRIAVQSATVGMGLSLLAMAFAGFGYLPPAAGALLQEGIDVAVILNALRALRPAPSARAGLPEATQQMVRRFDAEHDDLRDALGSLRETADRIAEASTSPGALTSLCHAHDLLIERILPHERDEEVQLYPSLAQPLGGAEATATMSSTHAEINRLSTRIGVHRSMAEAAGGISDDQREDLLACLYGLHAVLSLHFLQEEENYFVLVDDDLRPG